MQAIKRDIRPRWGIVPVLGLALAATAPAAAQKDGLYDEGRVLEHMQNECGGTPDCVTIESRQQRIAVGQSAIIRAHCPPSHPYVVGWDTEQHEHLVVTALAPKPKPPAGATVVPKDTAIATASQVLVGASNSGGKAGRVTLFIGCSAAPPKVTAALHQRSGVPGNHTTFQGGNR